MKMFLLGALTLWLVLGGLVSLNEDFSLGGGVELFDGWLCYVILGPWLIVFLPIWVWDIKKQRGGNKNERKT